MIASASGSTGGTTFSRNRYTPYTRTRAKPVNPNSTKQQIFRSRIGNLAQQWRGLTASQRLAWNSQAATITKVNSLGQSYSPSGFGFFTGINTVRLAVGLAVVTSPPTFGTSAVVTSASVVSTGSTGVQTVTFAPAIAAASYYVLRATAVSSPGKTFFGRSQYKDVAYLSVTDTSPYVATTAYAAVFGAIGTGDVGKRIAWQLVPVDSSGHQGVPFGFTNLVV